jgi:hypothetical protein
VCKGGEVDEGEQNAEDEKMKISSSFDPSTTGYHCNTADIK